MYIELKKPEERYPTPGERIILIDGIVYGRTVVQSRGIWGKIHRFRDALGREIDGVAIRVTNRRKSKDHRSTEQRVAEKVGELIDCGKLRHPDALKAERAAAIEAYEKQCAAATEKEERAFRDKAACCLVGLGLETADFAAVQARIIAAMRWAQNQ